VFLFFIFFYFYYYYFSDFSNDLLFPPLMLDPLPSSTNGSFSSFGGGVGLPGLNLGSLSGQRFLSYCFVVYYGCNVSI
jgi:hypothetical protein